MYHMACTELQCLYNRVFYLSFTIIMTMMIIIIIITVTSYNWYADCDK